MRFGQHSTRAARRADADLAELRALVRAALDPNAPGASGRNGAPLSPWAGGHPPEMVVASYLDEALSAEEEANFERHVAFCSECAQELVLARRSMHRAEERHSHRGWKIAAGIAVALGGLIAALLAAGAVGGRLESTIVASVERAFDGKATIDGVKLALAGGPAVELSGLKVASPGDEDPLLTAPVARLNVDLASLRHGHIEGSLVLSGPIINVVRDPAGALNIDAILPRSSGSANLIEIAGRKVVRSVEVSNGTLRLIDRSGDGRRELRMAAVDASLTDLNQDSPARLTARAGVESAKQNLAVSGTMGPWGGGQTPVYKFDQVKLDAVALRNLPAVGNGMRGGLSYVGSLASAGDSWSELSGHFSGGGDLEVVSGSLVGRNVIGDVLSPMLAGRDAAAASPDLATLVAANDTPFDDLRSPVSISGSRISASDLHVAGHGFAATGQGSLDGGGQVEFRGSLQVSAAMAREIVAMAPAAAALVNDRSEIAIPFSLSGTWPDVQARVDVEGLAAETLLRHGLARIGFLLRRGLFG